MRPLAKRAFGGVLLAAASVLPAWPAEHAPAELLGTWKGTSVCTDRVAAPACKDEVIVYVFTAGATSGTVRWQADKVVDGRRESMGDPFDVLYDKDAGCWKTEFRSPRAHVVWCLSVDGDRLEGSAWLLPAKEKVRRVDARREH